MADLPAADRAEFEAIAGMCGIGLDVACYCPACRDGMARGEPGGPSVGAKVLGLKVWQRRGSPRSEGGSGERHQAAQNE